MSVDGGMTTFIMKMRDDPETQKKILVLQEECSRGAEGRKVGLLWHDGMRYLLCEVYEWDLYSEYVREGGWELEGPQAFRLMCGWVIIGIKK